MPDFKLPNLGEDIEEVDVLKVLVSVGDTVAVDQPLLEIETEKATLEVPAESAGTVTKVYVVPGETIRAGQLIVTIESSSATVAAAPAAAPAVGTVEPVPQLVPVPYTMASAAGPVSTIVTPLPVATLGDAGAPSVFAAPSVRQFAREVGVDLTMIVGSGPGGRVSEEDVKHAARARAAAPAPASLSAGASSGSRGLPEFSQWGPISREPLTRLRRTIARNMAQSWREIPHVHLHHQADITAMEALRQEHKDRARVAGGNLTISVMILQVVAAALRAHPRVNASYDEDAQELIIKDYVHLGVAVDTDRGLVVPKIEHADTKGVIELSVELSQLAERARTNSLTVDEMRGGSFTVTNLGSLGTEHFTPIINWPEVAILGLGRARWQGIWDAAQQRFEPRLMMPMSLGHDHRVLDGADGARFMTWMVNAITDPAFIAGRL